MPKKTKIEQNYDEYTAAIEHKTQEEINKIKEKIEKIKKEAEKVGETIESMTDKNE
jgi:predicted transcriptional regulator